MATERVRRIGILGGTFDPIHFGHLRPAEEVAEALQLDELRLIPARTPPHRARPRLSAQLRAELIALALSGHPIATLDTRELERAGPSYTVDTLAAIAAEERAAGAAIAAEEQAAGQPAVLLLILGYDSFVGLPAWSRWRRLFDYAHLVVTERPGSHHPLPAALASEVAVRRCRDPQHLHTAAPGRIYFHPVTPLAISATAIRSALASGRSVRYLLPEPVRQRIVGEALYGYPQVV
ncbi:nicotinic acid mononucleotide adenylyltransferase [Halorhodospira abdelmalekii]|uniref:nicotinate-nucleotide adenylyltransferase n=1 Tax=Halorhodospira abdelmalekii TaxID=421629 RepID=UPI001905E8BD|nr:nicotinate-nucleotide adenylyltransferase [Halorhodospira abdelmalekii]MBK1734069.1 nicotinic acid mononucleotide adenylyltransferase [Halorhodospira abdelmalekii]